MAKIVPSGWRELQATGAAQRELETLALLAEGLPEDFTVYHGVHWTRIAHGFSIFGELTSPWSRPVAGCWSWSRSRVSCRRRPTAW